MKTRVQVFLLCVLPLAISAQKVEWEATSVNFGNVRDWNSPPATFRFTNTGSKKLMFLPQKHGREVLVSYPNRAFMPGESGEISIQYFTGETGAFSQSVDVYTNASNRADQLSFKGNIKSIYANALTACPSFQDPQPISTSEPNVIQVVDAATDRPIPNAQVEVFDRGIRKAINGTNRDGVAVNWIETGTYVAVASKDGYQKAEQEVSFSKRNRNNVIYLNRNVASKMDEQAVAESVDGRWEDEPIRSPEIRVRVSEVAVEEMNLGIRTNDQLDEIDLGIATNDVLAEAPTVPQNEVAEVSDLGIRSNDQWDEPVAQADPPVIESRQAVVATPEPEFSTQKFRPNNVLLLMDVSGSMKEDGKMEKLKSSIHRLVMMLREVDVLTLIAYNSDSWVVLPPTPVTDNLAIVALVDSLQPYGYTNGVKGMESAYESLEKQLIPNGNNQLIIATDGMFNSSRFSENDAMQLVKANSDKGIVLSIIGFGDDKEAGRMMKRLADLGAGSFLQVKGNEDPTDLLAEEIKLRSLK